MNITELIEELELDAAMQADMENARPEDGRLSMEAAGTLRRLFNALKPFAEAADIVDLQSEEQSRLLGSTISANASPGWGIRRHHLDTARAALWENVTRKP